MKLYILNDLKQVVEEPSHLAWSQWMFGEENLARRQVGSEAVGNEWLSTVFLGLDWSHGFCERPHYFETALTGREPGDARILWRGTTWQEAEIAHANALRLLKADKKRSEP